MKDNKKVINDKKTKVIKETKKETTPIIEKINLNDYVSSNKEKRKGIIGTIILIVLVGILLFGDLFDFNDNKKASDKKSDAKTEEKEESKDSKEKTETKDTSTETKDSTVTAIPTIGDAITANANMKYSVSSDNAVLNNGMYSVSDYNYYIKPNQTVTVNYIAIVGEDGTIYGFSANSGTNAADFAKSLNITNYKIVYHVKTDTTDIGWIVYNETDYNKVK